MISVARLVLLPVGFALAAAAFVNAASGAGMAAFGTGPITRSGLNAAFLTAAADRNFRLEISRHQPQQNAPFPKLSGELDTLARKAFAADPLEASSLRTIALGSIVQQDPDRARRVMHLAEGISKRDEITNLWLAQDYGQAGNLEAMITSFDHALRTSTRVREFAIKPVVGALASPDSYVPLGRLLDKHPEWEENFWGEFAQNPVGVANAANFFAGSKIPVDRLPQEDRTVLYANLKQSGQFETLYRLSALDPDAKTGAEALAAGKFVAAGDGNPLGWTTRSRGDASALVVKPAGELQIDARAGAFGVAADRVIRGGGSHKVAVTMAEPVPDDARVRLTAKCAGSSGQELGSITIDPGEKGGELSIASQACPFVSLELSFNVDPGRRDALLRVASVTLDQ